MKEAYLGPKSDQTYIATYLENIRNLDPIEVATLPNPVSLADREHISAVVDIDRFWEVSLLTIINLEERYGINIYPLRLERCYVSLPPEITTVGGFHDHRSLGYQYWYNASFVVTLGAMVSKELRTIELLRNFIHDCLHHSTFRSFRRVFRIPARSPNEAKHRVPEVYREQYGINFRNQDGLSYSSPDLTAQTPVTINLNLLMDGIIFLVTAAEMKEKFKDITYQDALDAEITKEIFLEPFEASMLPRAHNFHTAVTTPSKIFIEHWGGEDFVALVLKAMMSGDLAELKYFFQTKTRIENAWEKLFKRPEFSINMGFSNG